MAISDGNIITVQHSGTYSDGAGDDVYVLSGTGLSAVSANATILITDGSGANKLLLQDGLSITESKVFADAMQLTLSNGAVVQLLKASTFTFFNGGSPAEPGAELDYAAMATAVLGVTVPAAGSTTPATGGTATVGGSTGGASEFSITATAAVAEGNTGTATLDVTVTRTGDTAAAGTVDVSTTDGTATTADSDYTAVVAQTVSFAAGETTKTVTLSITGDTTVEVDETFTASLANATGGATISTTAGTATLTITNDDAATFVLTTEDDNVVGTAGDDTLTGISSTLTSERTLDTADVIDGGTGADSLDVEMKGNFSGFAGGTNGSMKGVETLNLTNPSTSTRSFNLKDITDLTTVNIDAGDKSFSLSGAAAAGLTVNVSNEDESKTLTVTHDAGAVTGTADELTVGMTDVGTAKTTTTSVKELALSSAGIETLNVVANGTGGNFAKLALADTTKVVVSGTGELTASTIGAKVKEIDASATEGKLNIMAKDSGVSIESVKMGKADDVLTVKNIAVTATLDGGAGEDTLIIDGATGTTVQPTLTNFETLGFTKLAGAYVVSGANTSGVNTVQVINDMGSALTLASLPNSSLTIELTDTVGGSGSGSDILTYTNAGSLNVKTSTANTSNTAKDHDITAAAVTDVTINIAKDAELTGTVKVASATSVAVTNSSTPLTALSIDADKVTSVNITSAAAVKTASDTSFDKLESLTLEVAGAVEIGGATTSTVGTDDLSGKAESVEINASAVTGTVKIDMADYAAGAGILNFTGSSLASNTLAIGTGRNEITVKGGISVDAITVMEVNTASQSVAYNFDLGTISTTDTVTFGTSSDITGGTTVFKGVDAIDGTSGLTLNASSVTGQDIDILDVGILTLKGTSSADTIDVSELDVNATVTNNLITPLGGADTITLDASEVFTVVFADSGKNTITNFTNNADVMNFAGATVTGTAYSEVTTASHSLNTNSVGILVVDENVSSASASMTASQLYTAIVSDSTNTTAGDETYILVTTDVTSAADAYIYKTVVNGGDDNFSSATLVATLIGITDVTSFVTDDFVMS